jgi:hypothetical protein
VNVLTIKWDYFSGISLASLLICNLTSVSLSLPYPVTSLNNPVLIGQIRQKGPTIRVNGRTFKIAWHKWQENGVNRLGISDTGAMYLLGLNLLDTENPTLQPISWFSQSSNTSLTLQARLDAPLSLP